MLKPIIHIIYNNSNIIGLIIILFNVEKIDANYVH